MALYTPPVSPKGCNKGMVYLLENQGGPGMRSGSFLQPWACLCLLRSFAETLLLSGMQTRLFCHRCSGLGFATELSLADLAPSSQQLPFHSSQALLGISGHWLFHLCVSTFHPQRKPLRTRSHFFCPLQGKGRTLFPTANPYKGLKEQREVYSPETASYFNIVF